MEAIFIASLILVSFGSRVGDVLTTGVGIIGTVFFGIVTLIEHLPSLNRTK